MSQLNLTDLIRQLQQQQQAANTANEQQYQQLLAHLGGLNNQVQGTFADAQNQINQIGNAQTQRINEEATQSQAAQQQSLISRGLGNTTLQMAAQRGVAADREKSLLGLNEMLAGQKAGLLQNRAGMEYQLGSLYGQGITSRVNQGPDMGLYASLMQAAGQGSPPAVQYNRGGGYGSATTSAHQAAVQQASAMAGAGGGGSGVQVAYGQGQPAQSTFSPSVQPGFSVFSGGQDVTGAWKVVNGQLVPA